LKSQQNKKAQSQTKSGVNCAAGIGPPEGMINFPNAGFRYTGCVVQQMMMKIDDATASRLYLQCKAGASVGKEFKESIALEKALLVILGVPCVADFGFSSSRRNVGRVEISSCVWIFSRSGPDFFGSSYLRVEDGAQPLSILNTTICDAIEQAKANKKFQEKLAMTENS
jgi:hypothetical protein